MNADADYPRDVKLSALFVAGLASFLTPFMGSAINVALPAIAAEFEMDAVALGWVPTSYILASAVFLLPFGRLADIHGRKRVFSAGLIVYTAGSLLSGAAGSAAVLIGARVIQGLGSSLIFGTGTAILTSVFPPGERGRALGVAVACVYLGLSLGPTGGGLLTEYFGWRSIFMVNVPLGLLACVAVSLKLKGEWAEARGERFDTAGSLIYAVALPVFVYGLASLPKPWAVGLVAAGLLGLAVFLRFEARVEHPVLDTDLFRRNRVFAFSSLAALINYGATFSVGFLLSLFLQYAKGFSPREAGLVLVAQPVIMALFSPMAGRLSDRVEPRRVASAGMALTTVGLAMLCRLDEETSLGLIIASLVVLGFGFALFSSPNTNAIMSSVEKRHFGVASSTVASMRLLGFMLSLGLVMVLFSLLMGKTRITPEHYPEFLRAARIAFSLSSIFCFLGIFASLARGTLRPESSPNEPS